MNNGEPFKLRTLHAVTDCIKEVAPANGYVSDLADFDPGDGALQSRVFRGRAWFGVSDPIPMVSVLEAVDADDDLWTPPADSASSTFDWPLIIQGFVNDDPENPTDPAYRLMRDVRRRLLKEKKRTVPGRHTTDPFGTSLFGLPGCRVTDMMVSTGKVRPADDVSAKAYFHFFLTLRVTEDALEA